MYMHCSITCTCTLHVAFQNYMYLFKNSVLYPTSLALNDNNRNEMNALKVLKPSRSFLHERWAFPSCGINQFRFWLYSK